MTVLLLVIGTWGTGSVLPQVASANVGEAYGFGSRSAALAAPSVAMNSRDGYSAYTNPARLALRDDHGPVVGYGFIYADPEFLPIESVVVENEYTSDRLRSDQVDLDYRTTFGQTLGGAFRLAPQLGNLSAGMVLYVPIEQLAYMDSGETFIPEYVLYRSRTQRPQFDVGVGAETLKDLYVGVGIHLGYTLTGQANLFIQTVETKPSSMRYSASLKPKAAPFFGVHFEPASSWNLGAVVRLPLASRAVMALQSGARTLGDFAALDFHFDAVSVLYYDPLMIEIGGSFEVGEMSELGPTLRTLVQLDIQRWSAFEPPALSIGQTTTDSCSGDSCGITISPGATPSFEFQDVFVPRIGEELRFGSTRVRFGYAYRMSILKSLPVGAGNLLDPPKHMLSGGLGFDLDTVLGVRSTIDLHGLFQYLVIQKIVKSAGDEIGTESGQKIGSPSYNAGGRVWGGGASLSMLF